MSGPFRSRVSAADASAYVRLERDRRFGEAAFGLGLDPGNRDGERGDHMSNLAFIASSPTQGSKESPQTIPGLRRQYAAEARWTPGA